MDKNTVFILFVLVTIASFLILRLMTSSIVGNSDKESKQIRERLKTLEDYKKQSEYSLVRLKFLRRLSPMELWLESQSVIKPIDDLIEQTGKYYPAYKVLLIMFGLGITSAIVTGSFTDNLLFSVFAFLGCGFLPIYKLKYDSKKRLATFEEQLPEAIDTIVRALRAGYPFNDAMQYVSQQMPDPIAYEFKTVFDEINYGQDIRIAFNYLLIRVPSKNLISLVSAILIQRETGGNLAELLNKISLVMRNKVRFQRKVMTLTAEARISAIVLALLPVLIFIGISVSSPSYVEPLFDTEIGHLLLQFGLVLQITGVIWVRNQISFDI